MNIAAPRAPYMPLCHTAIAQAAWCMVIPQFLSQDECAQLIFESEQRGYLSASTDYPPSYRNNAR